MPQDPNESQQLNEIIAAYLQAVESGQAQDLDQMIAQHPDMADDLRSFFANHDLQHAGPGKRGQTARGYTQRSP